MITVTNLTYSYPGEDQHALSGISFDVAAGECVCFSGHSGCGKTTLLLGLKGLLPEGDFGDNIQVDDTPLTREQVLSGFGLVFQNAESQLLCSTVFDEVAFGPENLCTPPVEINRRIIEALTAVDLLEFGNRNVERFSAGQKQRLCIASVHSMQPRVLLLDEPTSQLDRRGRNGLLTILKRLKAQGITIIIAEHNIEPFIGIIDRYYLMSGGMLTDTLKQPPEQYRCKHLLMSAGAHHNRVTKASSDPVFISRKSLFFLSRQQTHPQRCNDIGHERANSCIFMEKTAAASLLFSKYLAGAIQPDTGSLTVCGKKDSQGRRTTGNRIPAFPESPAPAFRRYCTRRGRLYPEAPATAGRGN